MDSTDAWRSIVFLQTPSCKRVSKNRGTKYHVSIDSRGFIQPTSEVQTLIPRLSFVSNELPDGDLDVMQSSYKMFTLLRYVPCYLSNEALRMRKDTVACERILETLCLARSNKKKIECPYPNTKNYRRPIPTAYTVNYNEHHDITQGLTSK